jgi:hypothetical protein
MLAKAQTTIGRVLLVVALELFGLVVAAGLALPWAVKEPIGLGLRVLVQVVIPCRRLTIAAGAAAKGRRYDRIVQKFVSIDILGHDQMIHGMVAEADK